MDPTTNATADDNTTGSASLTTDGGADDANTTGSASVTTDGGLRGSNPDERCDDQNCNFGELLSTVPRGKCTQFVTKPKVVQKPLLVNGFTTVFQLDGQPAKLCDVKNPGTGNTESQALYRIVPNTHLHIVNYIVVDKEDLVDKISENDPATMQKLLKTQRVCAAETLKKLMGTGQSSAMATAPAASVSSVSNKTPPNTDKRAPVTVAAATSAPSSTIQTTTLSTHPSLVITSVQGGEDVAAATSAATVPTAPGLPLITPVPLAHLQNNPLPVVSPASVQPAAAALPDLEKMRSEIEELRRTVAELVQMKRLN